MSVVSSALPVAVACAVVNPNVCNVRPIADEDAALTQQSNPISIVLRSGVENTEKMRINKL